MIRFHKSIWLLVKTSNLNTSEVLAHIRVYKVLKRERPHWLALSIVFESGNAIWCEGLRIRVNV